MRRHSSPFLPPQLCSETCTPFALAFTWFATYLEEPQNTKEPINAGKDAQKGSGSPPTSPHHFLVRLGRLQGHLDLVVVGLLVNFLLLTEQLVFLNTEKSIYRPIFIVAT